MIKIELFYGKQFVTAIDFPSSLANFVKEWNNKGSITILSGNQGYDLSKFSHYKVVE